MHGKEYFLYDLIMNQIHFLQPKVLRDEKHGYYHQMCESVIDSLHLSLYSSYFSLVSLYSIHCPVMNVVHATN